MTRCGNLSFFLGRERGTGYLEPGSANPLVERELVTVNAQRRSGLTKGPRCGRGRWKILYPDAVSCVLGTLAAPLVKSLVRFYTPNTRFSSCCLTPRTVIQAPTRHVLRFQAQNRRPVSHLTRESTWRAPGNNRRGVWRNVPATRTINRDRDDAFDESKFNGSRA